ncbi:MAG: ApaG domain, partial [Vicinamibacterales bacterium]
MPEAVTKHIRVQVESEFAPERSNPQQSQWSFYYTVRVVNEGGETVQLLSRHWLITDAMGATREVRGPGVVGKQPRLGPGESF